MEALQAHALGLTVTVATPATWDAMTQAQFGAYTAIVIGDPSSVGSCSPAAPADAVSTTGTWGPAATGNVAVLGTTPVLGGATKLIQIALAFAALAFSEPDQPQVVSPRQRSCSTRPVISGCRRMTIDEDPEGASRKPGVFVACRAPAGSRQQSRGRHWRPVHLARLN